jgi:hypothetical protein|tara:strand:+ start:1467 stop:1814 length:348 start_codon:yes stop_codon:yes gene_type:complete
MASFNRSLYPHTTNCQSLDAQISDLRNDKDLVYRGKMSGSKKAVKDFLQAKEIQFETQLCSRVLEDSSVYQTLEMQQDEFEIIENRVIGESNIKRNVMLVTGGVVLIVGLAIFIK